MFSDPQGEEHLLSMETLFEGDIDGRNIRNKGFTFVELIVSIFILSLLIVVAFTSFNIKVHSTANTINELEVQGNVGFAAIFINNLLSDCELKI